MAPISLPPLSPAELSYIHTSLAQTPPLRPDSRTPTQFRPLIAESDILPSTNGSARICFADGTEAVVGVKAEVERSGRLYDESFTTSARDQEIEMGDAGAGAAVTTDHTGKGLSQWVEVAIDIPGYRDDDALPVFLGAMLTEALVADGSLKDRLYINTRFHWRLYVDVLLLSQPLSYPLPLLSLTTHLSLLHTRLPALISEKDEDPLFNDDWEASMPLYPSSAARPPITLLVMTVASNIIFDPSREELAVADAVLAVSVGQATEGKGVRVLAIRTIDPPSRLTGSGNPSAGETGEKKSAAELLVAREKGMEGGGDVWRTPRGGVKRAVLGRVVKMVVEKGGVGEEVIEALEGVEG